MLRSAFAGTVKRLFTTWMRNDSSFSIASASRRNDSAKSARLQSLSTSLSATVSPWAGWFDGEIVTETGSAVGLRGRFRAMISLSKRIEGLAQSEIRRMSRESDRVGAINLGQGLCDLPTLPSVAEAAKAAIDGQQSTYTYAEGTLELRQAIAGKLERFNGITADPMKEIVVTVGASGAFTSTIHALLNPGDGILLMEPYYGYHLNTSLVSGLEPHYLTLQPPDFKLTEEVLRASIKPNTRAMVVCTPSNPSGKMFTREEIEAVANVAREHDLLVITDEIYEYIRYDGREHISPATVSDLRERTVTIMGLSKTFSITGWRLGYVIAPPRLAAAITLCSDLFYICAPHPLQRGVTAGFSAPQSFFDDMLTDYAEKRDILCGALDDAGMKPIWPQGSYYVLADVSHWGLATAKEASMTLLEGAKVASVAGSAFYRGKTGEGLLRFCFAKETDVLRDAGRRLRDFKP